MRALERRSRIYGSWPILTELVRRVWKELNEDDATVIAAGMSYYFALALFPFLIFLAAVVGTLPFTGLWDQVLKWITYYFPQASQQVVLDTIASLTQSRKSFLSIGLIGTVWAASGGLMSLMSGLNTAYEVKETRGYCKRTGLCVLILFLIAVLLLSAFGILTAGGWIGKWLEFSSSLGPAAAFLWHVGRWIALLILAVISMAVLDHLLPNMSRPWHWLTPGIAFMVLGGMLSTIGLNFYVRFVASNYRGYGVLGGFIVLMLWIYITTLVVLVGAEINSELSKMRGAEGCAPRHMRTKPLMYGIRRDEARESIRRHGST